MKILATIIAIIVALSLLGDIADEVKRGNDLHKQELTLHEIETVAHLCDSKSGSVDYEKKNLNCDGNKQAQQKKFRPSAMPNVL